MNPLNHFINKDRQSHNKLFGNRNDCDCPECQKYQPIPISKPSIPWGSPTPEQEALWQKKLIRGKVNDKISSSLSKRYKSIRQEELDKQYAMLLWRRENTREWNKAKAKNEALKIKVKY